MRSTNDAQPATAGGVPWTRAHPRPSVVRRGWAALRLVVLVVATGSAGAAVLAVAFGALIDTLGSELP